MARELRQSTAVTVTIGPFVDATDGVTAETGLTISQADVRLSKNDAAFAQKNDATSASHKENGFYSCPLNATDTSTLGLLRLAVFESGAAPVWEDFLVVSQSYWDAKYGTGAFPADTVSVSGTAQTPFDIGGQIGDFVGVLGVTMASFFDDASATDIANAVWGAGTRTLTANPGLDAAGVRTAVGLASANLDTQLDALPTAAENADAVHDEQIDGTTTHRQSMRLINSALGGKLSGAGSGTETVRDLADSKNRLVYTVDNDGNRTAITRDLT
jgi:hypothetical protein